MIKSLLFYLALPFCLGTSAVQAQSETESFAVLSHRELELPSHQSKALLADGPISSMVMDDSNGIWLLGKKYLWRWALLERQLQKFQISKDDNKKMPFQHLLTNGKFLFFANRDEAYQMQLDPIRLLRLPIPNQQARTLALGLTGEEIFWTTTSGTYKLNSRFDQLALVLSAPFNAQDYSWYDHEHNMQWIARGNAVLLTGERQGKVRARLVHQAKHPFIGLTANQSEVYAYTENTLLRFDRSGALLQAIPVQNGRKLRRAEITPASHNFIFDDGLIEIYDIRNEIVRHYQMPHAANRNIAAFHVRSQIAAFVADGVPRVIHLQKK